MVGQKTQSSILNLIQNKLKNTSRARILFRQESACQTSMRLERDCLEAEIENQHLMLSFDLHLLKVKYVPIPTHATPQSGKH